MAQYRLSTLLLCVVAIGIWTCRVVDRAERQRKMVAVVRSAGGTVVYGYQRTDQSYGRHSHVDQARKSPVPAWLSSVVGEDLFVTAVGVSLGYKPATQDLLGCMSRVKTLEVVTFGFTRLEDDDLMYFEQLPNLRLLVLFNETRLTFQRIADLEPHRVRYCQHDRGICLLRKQDKTPCGTRLERAGTREA